MFTTKLIVGLIAVGANIVFQYFGYLASKSTDLTLLGWSPEHPLAQSLVITLRWFWILLIANVLFSYAAKMGVSTFDSFLTYILIFAASVPIASLILNTFTEKTPLHWSHMAGVILVIAASILISEGPNLFTS